MPLTKSLIHVDDNGGSLTVDGTVAATQSGTWNLTNISGTVSLPTGASTSALQTTGNTSLSSIDTKTPALGQAAMVASSPVVIASNQSAVPVSQSGTWNIGTLTTITNVVHIDDNSGSLTVDNNGTFAVQATLTAETTKVIGTVNQGTSPWVISGAVTNAGTFAVQATIAASATNIAKAEDTASADLDVGVPTLAVRKATPANTSGSDGDYEFLQMSAGRLWTSAVIDTALPAGTALIGKVGLDQTTPGTTNAISLAQIGANTVLTGNGITGTGSQRVTIASDNTAFTVNAAQSGTWNITNISGTVSLPTGAATETTLGTLNTNFVRPATSTVTSVAGNTSSVTLLASNANRKAFALSNDSTSVCFVKFGATATTSSFTMKMAGSSGTQIAFYESPERCYTGVIDAIWTSANGSMRITELT